MRQTKATLPRQPLRGFRTMPAGCMIVHAGSCRWSPAHVRPYCAATAKGGIGIHGKAAYDLSRDRTFLRSPSNRPPPPESGMGHRQRCSLAAELYCPPTSVALRNTFPSKGRGQPSTRLPERERPERQALLGSLEILALLPPRLCPQPRQSSILCPCRKGRNKAERGQEEAGSPSERFVTTPRRLLALCCT